MEIIFYTKKYQVFTLLNFLQFYLIDHRNTDKRNHERETETFLIPFRIPSNLSQLKSFHSLKGGTAQLFGEITLQEQTDICDPISESGMDDITTIRYSKISNYCIIKYHGQALFLILKQFHRCCSGG